MNFFFHWFNLLDLFKLLSKLQYNELKLIYYVFCFFFFPFVWWLNYFFPFFCLNVFIIYTPGRLRRHIFGGLTKITKNVSSIWEIVYSYGYDFTISTWWHVWMAMVVSCRISCISNLSHWIFSFVGQWRLTRLRQLSRICTNHYTCIVRTWNLQTNVSWFQLKVILPTAGIKFR